ncbi:MAG: hypothetical protein A3H06_01365 [Candidatus Colwellbacteria bacterium RIFCSPLOWO2_12_FULL_44_13]|uniref:Type 4 fimbrial biogenesis protein PilX N-terminal domain-containing protein n=3 Tax=Candidatus Colwelliibacteriota TaxID=1817904 RepID=A0A1G1Z699_9BACT|nr:MAG: hypothetical protein A3I31_00010 [Candidatus Colwellbacteria bacterium RIFCSPLOWO2_02_FULL_44_20b]OGY60221.1 MAG: hypothetical protein A3F24_00590 [Candidatus Colwellbacteria bacterium RIFCSPHIGHO2_12_FULL_44_17]OGY62008.1 MAG: hypothetical protein A3H06_01365 [Candidatus Colwellbacteria bacterium RIFCSPLOWO2_12_FULL_44_13]
MKRQKGQLSLQVLIFGSIAVFILSGFVLWAETHITTVQREANKSLAFDIAESGVEYYRWHLAHDPDDYEDGTGSPGPYIHEFLDKEGNVVGEFLLEITPPAVGSTVITVRSTGRTVADPTIEKIIEVKMGIPSFAKFAVVADPPDIRFGEGTEVFGLVHSNGGIRFDGYAHNVVSSAKEEYDDPDHPPDDGSENEFGVHTHITPVDPLPPATMPDRSDVFAAGRELGVPGVNFEGLSQDLKDIQTVAKNGGFHRIKSNSKGYEVVLKTNDTFDLYKVTSLGAPPTTGCNNYLGQDGWGTWTIKNKQFLGNYAFPGNGVIFLEDNIWVRGTINTARLTIASGRFPEQDSTNTSISITNDISYTNYDGGDILALIAQKNINIGLQSEDDLKIDGALVAINGRVGRYYYRKPGGGSNRCSPYHVRSRISLHGMIATRQRYGFAYTDDTGYDIRNITYDTNLLENPPPSFPLVAGNYEMISWKEVK